MTWHDSMLWRHVRHSKPDQRATIYGRKREKTSETQEPGCRVRKYTQYKQGEKKASKLLVAYKSAW